MRTPAYETYPAFSPDGRWIAYGSGGYGRWDVYVRPFPDDGRGEVRISDAGGRIPYWMPDGRELIYRTDDQRLMAVGVLGERTADSSPSDRPVLDCRPVWRYRRHRTNFDVDPAGARVLALMPADTPRQQSSSHVTIRLNASDEVRRRLAGPSPTR